MVIMCKLWKDDKHRLSIRYDDMYNNDIDIIYNTPPHVREEDLEAFVNKKK